MKQLIIVILTLCCGGIYGQVTYTKDIAPIIYDHCTTCHRPGEIGPFELTSYEDVRNRGLLIKAVTGSRYMPPWKADPTYSHFLEENYLTEGEINTIANWVDSGMEYGNASDEPALPDYPDGSLLGEPDLVLEFAETHVHKGNGKDEYRYFVLPTGLTEDRVIKAIEMRPGNSKIVHHALFFQDTAGRALSFDLQTPEYGFEGFGNFGTDEVLTYDNYPGYVPGTKPLYYPAGIGQKLTAGSDLVVQVHYAPWPVDEEDRSSINIFFADEDEQIERLVDDEVMLPFNLEGGFITFFLAPNQVKTFHGKLTFTEDRSLIGLSPHMHYLGKEWEVWLERPNGDRVDLLKINDWDFNWQGYYYFQQLIVAPSGSVLHAVAKYDNTENNPANPSSPPTFVTWGEGTTDEMYFLPVLSVPYFQGDENVIFTATKDLTQNNNSNLITNISPNPVSNGKVAFEFRTTMAEVLSIRLVDTQGRTVRSIRDGEFFGTGHHKVDFTTQDLPKGAYYININGKTVNMSKQLIKY